VSRHPPIAGGGSAGTEGTDFVGLSPTAFKYLYRGTSFTGLSASEVGWFYEDWVLPSFAGFQGAPWQTASTGSGTFALNSAGEKGGVIELKTGGVGSYRVSSLTPIVSNISTDKWYVATRFKTSAVPDSRSYVGLRNLATTKTVAVGLFEGIEATNFCIQYDGDQTGSALSLATAQDASYHVFEMYGKGDGKVYGRIDGGAEVNATMSAAPTDSCFLTAQINEGTSGAKSMFWDWVIAVFPR